jgi:CHAT domain-containing protein/tetratricopeptide (TPR) repeat protein
MRPADMHLTPQELQSLLFGADDSKDDARGGAAPEAQQHLSGCVVCQSVAKKYTNADSLLRGLNLGSKGFRNDLSRNEFGNKGTPNRPKRGKDCPSQETWPNLAAGLINEAEASLYVSHAAQCDWCGPLLKESMEDLAQPVTEEEHEALEKLASASPMWQRAMAEKIASASVNPDIATVAKAEKPAKDKTPKSKEKAGFAWWPKLVWASAGLAVVIVAVLVGVRLTREPDVNQLLAQAYTEQRTISLRMPGAKYGVLQDQRRAGSSSNNNSPALYEALSRLAAQRSRRKHDPEWLLAEGRAELLQGEYQTSVTTLDEAHRLLPQDDNIAIDFATALLQRASKSQFEDDSLRAINLLREVTARNPQNAVAWFNLAIASERMHLFKEALQAWDDYLKIDSSSNWTAEARERRDKLQKRLEEHSKASTQPLESPDRVVSLYQTNGSAEADVLDQRLESYLNVIVGSWLPRLANGEQNYAPEMTIKEAGTILAQVALERHDDAWLYDIIAGFNGHPALRIAITALGNAHAMNDAGDYARAQKSANVSAERFEQAGLVPGVLRARAEDIYASHFLQQGEICYLAAESLLDELQGKHYYWLEGQTQLEAAICANMTGRMEAAKQGAIRATELSERHNYGVLYLRATALVAELNRGRGDLATATRVAMSGLQKFWSGSYPSMRGYSLYTVLDSITEDSEEWYAQVSLGREAISLIADNPDHAMLAFEYQRVANAALRAGEPGAAQHFFQESIHQFSLAPPGDTTDILQAAAEIGMTRVQCLRGHFEMSSLDKIEPWIAKTSNRFLAADFYMTQEDVLSGMGRDEAARFAARQAIGIAEKGLKNIRGERERLAWTRVYDRAYRALVRLTLEKDTREAFEWWEWYKGAPLRTSKQENRSVTNISSDRGDLRADLKTGPSRKAADFLEKDTALISYVLLEDQAGAWFRDSSRTEYLKLSIRADNLQMLARAFAGHCADRTSDESEINSEQRQLYNALIGPLATLIGSHKKLVIEPDGVLDAVAFEALIDHEGRFLGQEYNIAISPGAIYLAGSRPTIDTTARHKTLAVADSLADAKAEVRQVGRDMPDSQTLLGRDATIPAILRAIRFADIFHFAGHAVPAKDGSGLLLDGATSDGDPEVLDAVLLEKATIRHTRLVVLSACGTAGNGSQTLSEKSSLARVFLATGVPQVVASRWPVDSQATTDLMERFYQRLSSGSGASDALRQARLEIKSMPGYTHPYYWAAFSVFGKT